MNTPSLFGVLVFLAGMVVQVKLQDPLKPGDPCYAAPKYGTCPNEIMNPGPFPGPYPCTVDAQCSGMRLCCNDTSKGRKYCSDPFESNNDGCPPALLPGFSTYDCYLDNNCSPGRKCCPMIPGSYCHMRCTDTSPSTVPVPPTSTELTNTPPNVP